VKVRPVDARFEAALEAIADRLDQALVLAESMVQEAMASVVERDVDRARRVLEDDTRMDALEVEIDHLGLHILALHRPVATDLRVVTTSTKAITDLERIGDLAGRIARVSLELSPQPGLQPGPELQEMGREVGDLLTELRESWHRDDVTVLGRVKEINQRFAELKDQAVQRWVVALAEHPTQVARVLSMTELVMALGRIGGHAENLSELIVFRVEGKDVRHR